jgi:hypothetical protein
MLSILHRILFYIYMYYACASFLLYIFYTLHVITADKWAILNTLIFKLII